MGFLDKAKELGNAAVEKGKLVSQIAKLKLEIADANKKITEAKTKIGDFVYENKIGVNGIAQETIIIDEQKEKIAEKTKELKELEGKMNNKTPNTTISSSV